ncbi:MAG: hypothetical protein QM778_05140 [Myxococcales bacterium]
MSNQSKAQDAAGQAYVLPADSSWAGAWKVAAAVGAVGLAGVLFTAFSDHERFAFSYLFAYIAFLTIALGGVFFGILQWLTNAGWSVTIRRLTEFLHWPLWVFLILFIPVFGFREQLYPWLNHAGHGEHGAEHADEAAGHDEHGEAKGGEHSGGEHDAPAIEGVLPEAEHAAHAKVLAEKEPYLNLTFFIIRAVIYFAAWILISRKFFQNSTKQDIDGDPAHTVSSQRFAPVAIIFFALTTTFAAFDWLMSLEPSWISTIFGVNFFAQCIVSLFATTILIGLSLRGQGHFKKAVNVEHFHDLGKLQFGFLVFWAYVNFSQYMLIWYASIPEETTYYHKRWDEGGAGWKAWSIALIFGHFIVPFFIILSRNAKRALTPLGLGAAIILCFHFAMVYWLVLPYYGHGLSPSLVDLACLMFVGGTYFALVFWRMTKHPIIPVKDPRLSRSLHFLNA